MELLGAILPLILIATVHTVTGIIALKMGEKKGFSKVSSFLIGFIFSILGLIFMSLASNKSRYKL